MLVVTLALVSVTVIVGAVLSMVNESKVSALLELVPSFTVSIHEYEPSVNAAPPVAVKVSVVLSSTASVVAAVSHPPISEMEPVTLVSIAVFE